MEKKYIEKIVETLIDEYGALERENLADPLDELIRTITSQNTTDRLSDKVFKSLKERFPRWDMLLASDGVKGEVEEVIRPAGLAPTKAERIIGIIRTIREREGSITLDRLREMPDDEVVSYLISMKGVGLKTAYCVLAFSLSRDVSPVDTHIHRVSTRIGIIPDDTTREKAHYILNDMLPEGRRYLAHLAMIKHGRIVCKARKPQCSDCCVKIHCDYYNSGRFDS